MEQPDKHLSKEPNLADRTVGIVGAATAVGNAHNAVGTVVNLATHSNKFAQGIRHVTGNGGSLFNNTVKEVFGAGINPFLAKLSFGVRAIEGTSKLIEGDGVAAAGKLTRGAAEAAVVVANASGIGALANIGTWVVTRKFASEHIGDFVENSTTWALGGTKEDKAAKKAQAEGSVEFPAAAITVPEGIAGAGLMANKMMAENGQPLTIGALPGSVNAQGMPMTSATLKGKQLFPSQVMAVNYDRTQEMMQDQNNALREQQQEQRETMLEAQNSGPYPRQGRPEGYWQDYLKQQGHNAPALAQNNASAEPTASDDGRFAAAVRQAELMAANAPAQVT